MDPTVVAAWIALAGTLVAQILAYRATSGAAKKTAEEQRKQLDRTALEQREQLDKTLKAQSEQLDRTLAEQRTRTLNERFATAAEQLGSDKPAVRLAGVYAMAGLADDWQENRQTCIDVLCAYLQLPYEPDPGSDAPEPQRLAFQASQTVRHTVIRVITAHLQGDAATSWKGLDLDFTGVVFDGGDFRNAWFTGGTVNFNGARFTGGTVNFAHTRFTGGRISFSGAQFSGGRISFWHARFYGGTVDFWNAQFSGGTVAFKDAVFDGGTVYFGGARFTGGEVDFDGARFPSGEVSFTNAEFSGGKVDFRKTEFSGGTVDFTPARFSGGEVNFSDACDWSVPPTFPRTGKLPPSVKLPGKEDQTQA